MTNRTVVILALATLTALLSTVLTTTSRAQDAERTVNLSPHCNMVTLTFPDGTQPSTLTTAVSPSDALQTVWRLDNATGTFQAFVAAVPQASDLTSLNLLDAVFVCVDAAATMTMPTVSPDPYGATFSIGLAARCNTVGLTFPDGTDPSTLTTAVSPAGALQALWRLDNATWTFQAYVAAAPEASDLTSLRFLDAVYLCMAAPGSLTMPWLEGMPPPPTPSRGSEVPENLFDNGSFEEGEEPWVSLSTPAWGTPFSVSEEAAHSGQQSALLEMTAGDQPGSKVFGVVQEVQPQEFPELISGYYRVGEWTRGTDRQYVQFVVIVMGANNMPGDFPNHQIRYPLAGIADPPFAIMNAKFVFVGTEEAVPNDWVYFGRNVRQDFIDQWGAVPGGFSNIRVLFEVRYDGKQEGETEVSADVFYDDLYLGPAEANPNGPEEATAP